MSQICKLSNTSSNNNLPVTNPDSYPYDVISTDAFIPVDTTEPRTINLMMVPTSGFRIIIKDASGMSNANQILINGNGNTIDNAPDYIIADTYGSVVLIFNGVEWNVIN